MKSAITAMSPRMSKGLMTPRLSMLLTPRTRGNLDEAVRATMPEKPALDEGPLAADASILERAAREAPMGMTREQLEGAQLVPCACMVCPLSDAARHAAQCRACSVRCWCRSNCQQCTAQIALTCACGASWFDCP